MALWTPEYIDTALWLDAADSSTITLESGAVSQWADKSGNENHLVQSTALARPSYQTGEHVQFDGTDDFLSTLGNVAISDAMGVFLVMRSETAKAEEYICSFGYNLDNGSQLLFLQSNALYFISRKTTVLKNAISEVHNIGTDFGIVAYTRNADTIRFFLNATDVAGETNTMHNFPINKRFELGYAVARAKAGVFFNGKISECVVVEDDSLTTRQKIEGYLAHKWGLAANLPADHLYKSAAPTIQSISGTITDRFGNPCQRKVYAVSRPTDATAPQILAHGLSDPTTGAYELIIPSETEVTRVVVSEDDDPLLNDLVDRVIPA